MNIIIALALCYNFQGIENQSQYPISERDKVAMKSASITCKKTYGSCLKRFIKTDIYSYRAICL